MQPWNVVIAQWYPSCTLISGVKWSTLCDRAGCQCIGPSMENNKIEGLVYDPAMAAEYAAFCFHMCHYLTIADIANVANAMNPLNHEEGQVVNLPGIPQIAATGLNPDGAILGHGGCISGEAAGWLFKRLAATPCCSGFCFNALSGQEAFLSYGFPYISDIMSGLVTIGVCLPKSGFPIPGRQMFDAV